MTKITGIKASIDFDKCYDGELCCMGRHEGPIGADLAISITVGTITEEAFTWGCNECIDKFIKELSDDI